jgi:CBS-domain-containing membrane protein
MAEFSVSCIVITQRDMNGNDLPVGIVTERDIVQFQAFQIDLLNTQADMVMSTPLFLLSPEDSLWTAHQEMQKRRVGRLVVSWNWGQGLGIVTQTSLLRVFDPMEMYGVIENLQQTIQQLEAERSRSNASAQTDSSSADLLPQELLGSQVRSQSQVNTVGDRKRVLSLLDNANQVIQCLMLELDLSIDQRKSMLQSVLAIIEELNDKIR